MTGIPGAPGLWHLQSKIVGGFYQSDVFVVARNRTEAVDQACAAFSEHIDHLISELYFASVGGESLDPEDDDYARRREEITDLFRAEANEQISLVESNRIVRCSS